MRKQELKMRRAKLPPILEIDEDGVPVNEMENWNRPSWNADDDTPGVSLGEWPTEFDD
jgi:hypothetical protein